MAPSRREFLKSAGVAGAAAAGAATGAAAPAAQAGSVRAAAQPPAGPAVRMVRTDVLDIGYEESGDPAAFPIILLHGFPYDVRSWDGVAPALADAGYRVLAPYLRGYGPTRFRDARAPRMAEQAAIAQDVVDFLDALGSSRRRWPASTGATGRRASRRSSGRSACARKSPSAATPCRTPSARRRRRRPR